MHFSPFNDVLDMILAKYFHISADAFKFHEGLPFGTLPSIVAASLGYVIVMMGGQEIMRGYQSFNLKYLIFLHNAIMSIASGLLFMLILEPLVPMWQEHGLNFTLCHYDAYTPRLELFYYLNYLFKLWEFIDTGFMVLRKRPLEFLHVYHHSATAAFTYMFLVKPHPITWFAILMNLTVHVLMYYYYAVSTVSKRKIWWKKHLTTMQISQFVLDLLMLAYVAYNVYTNEYFPWLKTDYGFKTLEYCTSVDPHTHLTVCAVIFGSYLILFLDFYVRSYNRAAAAKQVAAGAARTNGKANHVNGHTNGHTSGNGSSFLKEE
ncbi:very-long-chain 3-oxoacyl-CoA synthase [Synchytrium microbalum]|uniref:Elongation of fatty acids protein n=1 Tax=Synchytrium microbalum TaxID=1806994 RepID=A0A507CDV5_9FUNG|nr:very-long-chain 3-oxoacyl-CoA synthase [Synchytrium microbalum]TPX37691.1 very-long-chain 3-oxoacyl-CoA synthase [Synchytrium microbalum]